MAVSVGKYSFINRVMPWLCNRRVASEPRLKILTLESHCMDLPRDALLLRIFVGEADEHAGEPKFRKLVFKAREMGLAGATVLRGPLGFGRSSVLHASDTFRVSRDLPIVIEIVDTEEKIEDFLATVEEIVEGDFITLEKVQAIFYRGKNGPA